MMSLNLREQSSFITKLLNLVDCAIVSAFLWSLVTWYRVPWSQYYTYLLWLSFGLSLVSFQYFQLYRSWRGWKFYMEFIIILKAWSAVIGILLFYFFIFKLSYAYSRLVFFVWSVGTPVLLFGAHVIARKILRYFRSKGKNIRRAIVVGAGEVGRNLTREVEETPWAGIEVLGFFDDKKSPTDSKFEHGKPIIGKTSEIRDFLLENTIDYVYIALPMRAEKKIFSILRECRSLGARIYLVPDVYLYGLHHAEMQSLGNTLVLNFNPNTEWKRSFDVLFSLLVLTCISPLLVLIAIGIKLQDGGPVFYKHSRITATGREFGCLKFRSMVFDAEKQLDDILDSDPQKRKEWAGTYKLQDDPRITRFGRFLRKTSLDELPQFLNVLKGEMSVVGARPIVGQELTDFYKESAGRYCSMKPGITGAWQVEKRSDTTDYGERVDLDDWYILNYSLWTDIKIIAKTVQRVFDGRGAV
jgi:exopolysaccharide biosynthesis polyprenyl glycosylphosphotransferase